MQNNNIYLAHDFPQLPTRTCQTTTNLFHQHGHHSSSKGWCICIVLKEWQLCHDKWIISRLPLLKLFSAQWQQEFLYISLWHELTESTKYSYQNNSLEKIKATNTVCWRGLGKVIKAHVRMEAEALNKWIDNLIGNKCLECSDFMRPDQIQPTK